jgi:Ni/Co efflux regulator RcnB
MKTLALLTLTAAAIAVPTAADAQPRAGHSWGEAGQQRVAVRRGPGAVPAQARREFREIRRIGRGEVIPSYWAAPQFRVRHWQSYGFPQPMPGFTWIRYYDDALLVDRTGRVHDGRYAFDWDRYPHPWNRDDRGIPVYVGDGDYHPDERDHEWAEEAEERGWDYSEYGRGEGAECGGRGHGPCGPRHPGPGYGRSQGAYGYGQSGYGYGGSYGGGYGYGGATMTITETIVESSGSAEVYEEVIEEEIVETRARSQVRRAPRRAAPPPPRRPIRGERG